MHIHAWNTPPTSSSLDVLVVGNEYVPFGGSRTGRTPSPSPSPSPSVVHDVDASLFISQSRMVHGTRDGGDDRLKEALAATLSWDNRLTSIVPAVR